MSEDKQLAKASTMNVTVGFGSEAGFELMQRQAKMFSVSKLVPDTFKNNQADCCVALEMAHRIGANPLMVMQNLYIVHGKPAWSSQFLVSCINACGRFSPLRYRTTGEKNTDTWGVIAWAKDLEDGEILESPEVTIAMAKAEGWYSKNGSKWQTIPELMLRYRAATFFARTYAPDITMGMMTNDEVREMPAHDIEVSGSVLEDIEEKAFGSAKPVQQKEESDLSEAVQAPKAESEPLPDKEPEDTTKIIRSLLVLKKHKEAQFTAACNDLNIPIEKWQDAPHGYLKELFDRVNSAD